MVLYGRCGQMQLAPASGCLHVHPQSGAGGLPEHAPAGAAADQAHADYAPLALLSLQPCLTAVVPWGGAVYGATGARALPGCHAGFGSELAKAAVTHGGNAERTHGASLEDLSRFVHERAAPRTTDDYGAGGR
jgi:hypothetical protein